MDSRDLLIIAAVGFGAWWLWKRSKQDVKPAADVPSSGTSSYVAGAAQQTQTGAGTAHGLVFTTGAAMQAQASDLFSSLGSALGTPPAGMNSTFKTSATTLLALNILPKPVALTPTTVSSSTLGTGTIGGSRPAAQQLDTLATNPLRFRGLN